MSAFPSNPTNGQTANVNGIQYTYNSSLTAWAVTSGGGSITTASLNASGNINGGNLISAALVQGITVSASGNVIGNNITTIGSISATGNLTAGNVSATNLTGTLATAAQTNITSVGTLGSLSVTANVTVGNIINNGVTSVTGNITGGNILTAGQMSATGNITANNISTTNAYFTKTIQETVTINANPFTATSNYDLLTQAVWYSTASANANITLNIRGSATVTANTMLAVGQSVTFALLITNGATAYLPTAYQVDGVSITPKYQGGTAFSGGNANSTDVYSFTLIKTAATPTYTLLASQVKFA